MRSPIHESPGSASKMRLLPRTWLFRSYTVAACARLGGRWYLAAASSSLKAAAGAHMAVAHPIAGKCRDIGLRERTFAAGTTRCTCPCSAVLLLSAAGVTTCVVSVVRAAAASAATLANHCGPSESCAASAAERWAAQLEVLGASFRPLPRGGRLIPLSSTPRL